MATKTLSVSLTRELKGSIERRVRSGLYDDASDVVRAGLRALAREEVAAAYHDWREIAAKLPQEPITRKTEQRVERAIRAERSAERNAAAHK
jgi:putative addiction module CopG family antidote